MEDYQNGRQPKSKMILVSKRDFGPEWKTIKMKDDQNGRQPKCTTTKMEDYQNGRQQK